MAKPSTARELVNLITSLLQQRRQHEQAIAEIDQTCARFGIDPDAVPTRGRPAKAGGKAKVGRPKKKARRKRRTFKVSGEQSILNFVTAKGNPTTAEVNKHWDAEGRGGKADNALGRLVADGRLKRVKDKTVRGSRYALPGRAKK